MDESNFEIYRSMIIVSIELINPKQDYSKNRNKYFVVDCSSTLKERELNYPFFATWDLLFKTRHGLG